MAALKKPDACKCGSRDMSRLRSPERWMCNTCSEIIITRSKKPQSGICRGCGSTREEVEFANHANICKSCKSKYHEQYREKNKEKLREQHRASYQRDKKKRQDAIRVSNSRSPETWLMNLRRNLLRPSNRKKIKAGHSEATLIVQIDFEYLWQLYEDQHKVCAVTGLSMVHGPHSLRSMSIDRKDSSLGYVPGNVQIVCKFVNLGKSKHSQEETLRFFDDYFDARYKRNMSSICE